MNLHQLRSFRQVVKEDMSITRAARSLHTSQPGITRHIQAFEEEVGVPLFLRHKKRLVGLSSAGEAMLPVAERALTAIDDLRRVAVEFKSSMAGDLTVATVHTHARYVLPGAIRRFVAEHPGIRLRIRNGDRTQVAAWVAAGEADFSVATLPTKVFPELTFYACYEVRRSIVAPVAHPLCRKQRISLRDLAQYPIITYEDGYGSRQDINRTFSEKQLGINVVLSAADADIMKIYIAAGLGIGIISSAAYDPKVDKGLRAFDASHLFEPRTVHVGVRKGAHISRHARRLIELFAPQVSKRISE